MNVVSALFVMCPHGLPLTVDWKVSVRALHTDLTARVPALTQLWQ